MEDDPDKINDPNRQLEANVVKQAEKYQQSRVRSQAENKLKAEGRKEIDKLGFRTDAYQSALRVARDLTPAEQKQYVRDFRFFLKAFGDRQQELWPEDAVKAAARAKRKAERKAKDAAAAGGESAEAQERRLAADANPRSKPKASSARKPKAAKAAVEELNRAPLASAEANAAAEQAEGDQVLTAHVETMKADATGLTGKTGLGSVADEVPISQSQQAAAIRDKMGL